MNILAAHSRCKNWQWSSMWAYLVPVFRGGKTSGPLWWQTETKRFGQHTYSVDESPKTLWTIYNERCFDSPNVRMGRHSNITNRYMHTVSSHHMGMQGDECVWRENLQCTRETYLQTCGRSNFAFNWEWSMRWLTNTHNTTCWIKSHHEHVLVSRIGVQKSLVWLRSSFLYYGPTGGPQGLL